MQPNVNTALPAEQPSPIRVCEGPGCTKQLQSNNKSGYCELHEHIGRRRPQKPKLCAYSACRREFVPTKGHQNYCKPECRRKARNTLALEKYHKKRQLLEKQREEAVQIALQTVHDCDTCRKVLHKLFLAKPSAIERYHRDVKAALADPTISVQEENPCQCCHLAPVARAHGNSKLCIPCGTVRADESQRENSRRHRAKLRGEAPVEEVMLCVDCGKEVEPNPRTGKIDRRRLRCLECTEAHERDLKNVWKKEERAEERAEAAHDCPGKKIVDGLVHPCGERVVPEKSTKQEFCSTECWARTYAILHPERREYYRNLARKKAAERARLKNVEGLDLKTGLRCSLAAHWTLPFEGKSQYVQAQVIAPLLYSDSTDPVDAAKKFLGRWDEPVIKDERQRVAKLDADQRQMELKQLEVRLKAEQAKPLKKAS